MDSHVQPLVHWLILLYAYPMSNHTTAHTTTTSLHGACTLHHENNRWVWRADATGKRVSLFHEDEASAVRMGERVRS
jgi:hypothetical protein